MFHSMFSMVVDFEVLLVGCLVVMILVGSSLKKFFPGLITWRWYAMTGTAFALTNVAIMALAMHCNTSMLVRMEKDLAVSAKYLSDFPSMEQVGRLTGPRPSRWTTDHEQRKLHAGNVERIRETIGCWRAEGPPKQYCRQLSELLAKANSARADYQRARLVGNAWYASVELPVLLASPSEREAKKLGEKAMADPRWAL